MKKYTNEELTENIINMLKEKKKKDYKKIKKSIKLWWSEIVYFYQKKPH